MYKSFKIRLYPTKNQEELLWKHINNCRFIWNYMLNVCNRQKENGEKYLGYTKMANLLTPLKKQEDYKWLNDCSHTSYQIVCKDLDRAFQKFFNKQNRYPKFKSKKTVKFTYPVCNNRLYFFEKTAQIQMLGEVKYKTDFNIPKGKECKFVNSRIKYNLGKWILTVGIECENQALELNDFSVGIDLGIKELATVAYDNDKKLVFHNINKSKRVRDLNRQFKHTQRNVSRKYEANKQGNKYVKTRNIMREEEKLRNLYAKISNIRENYIHQFTHQIIKLRPKRVVMEDLNVSGMMKDRHLARAVAEQCFYQCISTMKYKCEWNGIKFVQVDRFYPSSKTCSHCGTIKKGLKLSDRVFKCECGYVEDRDFNAAVNLMNYLG